MTEKIIGKIKAAEIFSFGESFDIYRTCANLLNENGLLGRRLLINILANKSKFDNNLNPILSDLIEASGLYPYLKKEELTLTSTSEKIRNEYHHSDNLKDKYFHEEQKYILSLLQTGKNLVVSAPTSFGKSLLIEEIVASHKYQNIIIIQPTLALLEETRKKLIKYQEYYKIIVRTSQEPSTIKGNIFLLTAERVCEYKNFPIINFLIIDEFYKLSAKRDDERSDSLNNAFYRIITNFNCPFYLLGPNIDDISTGFQDRYNAIFYKTNYILVDCESIDTYKVYEGKFGARGNKKLFKEEVLFDLLFSLKEEQTIIYCSSPKRVRYLSAGFQEYLQRNKFPINESELTIVEWIQKNIGGEWGLINLLKYRIGVHDGGLQKHITSSIIDYFNDNKLNYLFCTTTIIEGVNTSAKNIVYFDQKKGKQANIDYFDYSNIKGRAGRFMVHYIGKIYNFNPPPPNDQVIVDIPFFQQNPISDEVLISLNDEDVNNKETAQYKKLISLPFEERKLFKRNGLSVFGQKSILDQLRRELPQNMNLIEWTYKPSYKQLTYILTLAWNNLLRPTETVRPMTLNKLIKLTYDYSFNGSIDYLIKSNIQYKREMNTNTDIPDNQLFDEAVLESFQILKHWFQYKIPKWMLVINDIQQFVCNEKGLQPGNYIYFGNLLENDFLRENLSILSEFGIPSSAIRKLEKFIPATIDQDKVLDYMKERNIISGKIFLKYEIDKINDNY